MDGCLTVMLNPRDPERKADREWLMRLKKDLEDGKYDESSSRKSYVEMMIKRLESSLKSYDFSKY